MPTGTITTIRYDIPANTLNNIVEFSTSDYRSGKLMIQGSSNNEHQTTEIFVIHDNVNLFLREVFLTYTQDPFITFTGHIVDNAVRILANTALPNTDIVVYGTMLEVVNKSSANSTISQDKILDAAKSMKGLYPDDNTDYVKAQTGSLYKSDLVEVLDRDIKDGIAIMSDPTFADRPIAEQQAFLDQLTATITERTAALQGAIDSDLNAIAEVNNKIEAGGLVTGIIDSYKDPQAKALLDLTLNSEIKAALQ